jgi:hypothetical protein
MTLPWPGDHSLPWDHPSRMKLLPPSLGPQVIRWAESNLVHHLYGTPWEFTPGQRRFLILWYSVDANGRFLFRRGVKRGAKGTGKDPFASAWLLGELAGPVRVADMVKGRPVGEAHRLALVQVAANSQAQAADVLRVANAMVSRKLAADIGWDPGTTRSQTSTGSRIELLTSSEASSEGDPATAIALNESHHMTSANGGLKVAKVAQRNVGKSPADLQARMIEFTNAHQQGSDSRAERSYTAWQAQVSGKTRTGVVDILYDSIEAPPTVDMTVAESLRAGILAAYCDAPWADIDRLCDEANDPDTSVADLIRYYLNGLATAEDAWIDPGRFDALARPDEITPDREQIAMFLDCSKSGDATGLVASRLSDGHVITLAEWHAPHGWDAKRHGPYRIPRDEVDAKVRATFDVYDVAWFGVDPSPASDDDADSLYWMPLIDGWHRDFKDTVAVWATPGAQGHSVLFDMRLSQRGAFERMRLFTDMAEQTAQAIDEDGSLTHDGHPLLRTHVHNARRRPNQWGTSLGKETRDSNKLVDLAVCMVGALLGRRIALNSGKTTKRKRTGVVW